ncbi:hypothetical protein WAH92_21425, partial [Acinetobacter baumannii]
MDLVKVIRRAETADHLEALVSTTEIGSFTVESAGEFADESDAERANLIEAVTNRNCRPASGSADMAETGK